MQNLQEFTAEQLVQKSPKERLKYVDRFITQNTINSAISFLNELTLQVPEHHELWEILANLYVQNNDTDNAQKSLNQFELIRHFNLQLDEAEKHLAENNLVLADKACRKLLQWVPNEIRTLRLLAKISSRASRPDISQLILSNCNKYKPNDPTITLEYIRAILDNKQPLQALKVLNGYEQKNSENIEFLAVKAEISVKTGDYKNAEKIYRRLLDIHPNKALCLLRLGNVLKIVGQTKQAITHYQQAITLSPSFGEAYWNLANSKIHVFCDSEINQMKIHLDTQNLSNQDRALLNFAMGKALENREEYAASFNFYKQGNSLCFKPIESKQSNTSKKIIQFFDSKYFENSHDSQYKGDDIIFIVGLPRSGSTLVEQILSSHSKIDGTIELTEIPSIASALDRASDGTIGHYPSSLASLSETEINKLAEQYIAFSQPFRQNGQYFTDKLPANFLHIGLIKTLFPNAKIIDVRRNPMACGWSIYTQFFAQGVNYSFDLEAIGRHYNNYLDMMEHWNQIFPQQILTVQYENLINNFNLETSKIFEYCGIEMESSCLTFYNYDRAIATPSAEQVRKPIYTQALNHWSNFEKFLAPLSKEVNRCNNRY